jgi:squalene-hopene/tetraprenyl-beta-curcumene cyclase
LARQVIRKLGGADAADALTRFFLALFGQVDYDCCPAIAPEAIFFNESHWRNFAALSVLWAHRPVRNVGIDRGVRELFIKSPSDWAIPAPQLAQRGISSYLMSSIFSRCEVWGWTPLRRRALDRVEQTLLQLATPKHDRRLNRLDASELILTMIALDTLGCGSGSKLFDKCYRALNELVVVEERTQCAWIQFRTESLTDTALTMQAMCASGLPIDQIVGTRASAALVRSERREIPDSILETAWILEVLNSTAHGNSDMDRSLPPAIQLGRANSESKPSVRAAVLRRQAQVLAKNYRSQLLLAQNRDGGWGPTLTNKSSSSPDVTGAVLQALTRYVKRTDDLVLNNAISYLRSAKRPNGSWTSVTGVRHIHGTSLAICGLLTAGVSPADLVVESGLNWLVVHQQADGGWGELPASSSGNPDADFVTAPSTATQTSWALLALLAANRTLTEPARRAVQFLLDTQEDNGRWHERHFVLRDPSTGRFYRNEMQSVTWPLLALSRWAVAASATESVDSNCHSLRLVGVSDL